MKTSDDVCARRASRAVPAFVLSCLGVLAADAAGLPVDTQSFGRTAEGRAVDIFTLRNARGMRVRLLSRGATIVEISAPDRDGKFANVVLGMKDFSAPDDPADWFNSVLGRYANRISHGGFTLDGRFFTLKANLGNDVVLHGGPAALSAKLWAATILEEPTPAVRLRCVSPDGENGFPGELTVTVTYSLDESNVLQIRYEATTTKPTVVNLTNHTFFNLGGHAAGPIYGEWLQVFANRWTPTDTSLVPTGQIAPVAGTILDFRQPTLLGPRVYSADPAIMQAHGLDHNLVLDPPVAGALRLAARLWDPPSGRQLEVRTSEPGLQLYSGNGFNGETVADDGRTLRQGDGLTFETQHFPDSPNIPAFPSTVLRPGEVFRSTTQFAFSTDREHAWFDQSGRAKAK